jgi:hypothetical protein
MARELAGSSVAQTQHQPHHWTHTIEHKERHAASASSTDSVSAGQTNQNSRVDVGDGDRCERIVTGAVAAAAAAALLLQTRMRRA